MSQKKILIAGAGISGLVAACQLLKAGYDVTVIEGRDRAGGRINTLVKDGYFVEAGPEFIHGRLEATFALLKNYDIGYVETTGRSFRRAGKSLVEDHRHSADWELLLTQMALAPAEQSLTEFLESRFAGKKWTSLRAQATGFASGFDLADPGKVSARSLAGEWQREDGPQFRLAKGYGSLIRALEADVEKLGGKILFGLVIERFEWLPGSVTFISGGEDIAKGDIGLITLPVAVVQQHPAPDELLPNLPEKIKAARSIGVGSVIKFVTEWKESFWASLAPDALFFFGRMSVPTWWTNSPLGGNQLTGWIGGPEATRLTGGKEKELLETAMGSLSTLFGMAGGRLKKLLRAYYIFDWKQDPLACGAYTFTLASSPGARAAWAAAVDDTLYFAGEACYDGQMVGTVEAAVLSAGAAVDELIEKHSGQ